MAYTAIKHFYCYFIRLRFIAFYIYGLKCFTTNQGTRCSITFYGKNFSS